MTSQKNINDYDFPKNPISFYLKGFYRDRGSKVFYQFLNRPHLRPYSRYLISKYAPKGIGLELGVGARTIAPVNRTILSDGFSEHGTDDSIAKAFFKADVIPYPENSFSFILSEHLLEHVANPIKTLLQWIKYLEVGGKLIITLPHRDRGNDRFRQTTTLEHLINDYKNSVPDNDDTHLTDWTENVVNKGLLPDHYKHLNSQQWIESGSIHHHVWVTENIIELFEYLKFKVIFSTDKLYDRRDSFLIIAQKTIH